ncbi:MAG TPA: protein kinase [Vicinamibacterales bacterium]|nr:protein kinase [Vicinamibacterales bacterium]
MTASPERWATVDRLYHAALARPVDERAAFVADACAGDEDLRREVESLLGQRTSEAGEFTQGAVIVAAGLVSNVGPSAMTGRRLGVYQILAPIGAGGMGEVYRARDPRLGRDVAIKILPRAFTADAGRLARFEREARVLASLNHPHIGAIYGIEEGPVEAGPHVGAGFSRPVKALILELVEGETLGERIRRAGSRGLPVKDVLDIARQLADALDAAHEKGIVHRDLKPANIKITPQGVVKVLDFGLAKLDVDEAARDATAAPTITVDDTREGLIVGTAAYMSPEQARGQAVDKRTDIWAFGCVLYEMLTGRAAFGAATMSDTIAALIEREPDWTVVPVEITAATRRLVRRCLHKDPNRRLRDIADARMDIEDALSDLAGDTAPVSVSGRSRGRWSFPAVVTITAIGLGAVIAGVAFSRRTPAPPLTGVSQRTIATQLTNYGGSESDGALSADGRTFAFVSSHGGTPDLYLRQVSGGEPVRLTNDEAEESSPAFSPDSDSVYFTRTDDTGTAIWRVGVLGGQPQKVVDKAQTPAPAPDGKRLAYVTGANPFGGTGFNIAVRALDGSSARTLAEHIRTGTFRPAWSPDGRRLAYSSWPLFGPTDVFVVDVESGRQTRVAQLAPPAAANDGGKPVWLPDNRHLVISYTPIARQQAPGDLGILDTEDGSIVRLTTTVGDGLYAPSISADGSRLVATRLHYQQEIWKVPLTADPDANGRAAVRMIDESAGPLWTFVSRDGRTILFNSPLSGSRNLWDAPLDGGKPLRQITTVPGDAISHSSLSPDRTRVAFASITSGHSDIWTQRVDGSDLRQATNDEPADSWPVWSPDGEWIVYQTYRDRPETWRVRASGGAPEKLLDQGFRGDWIRQPNGTGTWIVTSGTRNGSGVQLIDVERRAVLWEQAIAGGGLSLPMFSPDGRSISAPFRESRDHDVVRIFDTATGQSRVAVRLPFHVTFRADWVDDGRAIVVNRNDEVSHVVMFDHFWTEVGNTTK